MALRQDMNRLRQLAAKIERAHRQWMDSVRERDELVTDMMVSDVASGVEIGKVAGLSQPRTSQIKAATLARRAQEAAEARKIARREAARQKREEKKRKAAEQAEAMPAA